MSHFGMNFYLKSFSNTNQKQNTFFIFDDKIEFFFYYFPLALESFMRLNITSRLFPLNPNFAIIFVALEAFWDKLNLRSVGLTKGIYLIKTKKKTFMLRNMSVFKVATNSIVKCNFIFDGSLLQHFCSPL